MGIGKKLLLNLAEFPLVLTAAHYAEGIPSAKTTTDASGTVALPGTVKDSGGGTPPPHWKTAGEGGTLTRPGGHPLPIGWGQGTGARVVPGTIRARSGKIRRVALVIRE